MAETREQPINLPSLDWSMIDEVITAARATTAPLLRLTVTGVFYDRDRSYADYWVEIVHRLLQARTVFTGTFQHQLEQLRHYPALLALRVMGLTAVHTNRDDVLLRLLLEPSWRNFHGEQTPSPAADVLHDYRVLDDNAVQNLPRWSGQRWIYPFSKLLRSDLREFLSDLVPNEAEYNLLCDRYEYRVALVQHGMSDLPGRYKAASGEFIGEWRWDRETGIPIAETDFRSTTDLTSDDSPWKGVVGRDPEDAEEYLTSLRDVLERLRRWG